MAEVYSSYSPYVYVGNDPILFSDPNGMYRVDSNGNITIDDDDEIQNLFNYLHSNGGASINDMFAHIKADNGFFWELDPVIVTGSMDSYKSGDWIGDAHRRISDAEARGANVSSINISRYTSFDALKTLNDGVNNVGTMVGVTEIITNSLNTVGPAVNNLRITNKALAGAGLGLSAIGVGIEYNMMQKGLVSRGEFTYNTTGVVASALTGMAVGSKFGPGYGAVAGMIVGIGFPIVKDASIKTYNSLDQGLNQFKNQAVNNWFTY